MMKTWWRDVCEVGQTIFWEEIRLSHSVLAEERNEGNDVSVLSASSPVPDVALVLAY